jgi:membrane fusion protein, multidrug efflux system
MNSKHTNKTYLALPLVALLALTACNRKQQQQMVLPPPEVATFTVAEKQVLLTTELPGRTSPFRIAEVRPQVNGLVKKRLFTEGSEVKEGDPLYQIDPAPFQAALDNARAALARAEANLPAAKVRANRYQQALADRAVSQQDYDDASATLKQAEADVQYYRAMVDTARINLAYALVVSPISGRIGVSTVTDGAIVTAYQPMALATIQQLDPIYVDVPQSAIESLRLQQKLQNGQMSREGGSFNEVDLFLPDGTRYAHAGVLQFRDISVDPTTGTVILRMVFPNPDKVLLPGMFVRAVVREGSSDKAILVPQQTVSRNPRGQPLALIVDDEGTVQQRMLTLDRAIGDKWLVAGGLKPGDRIIAEGMQKVRPGAAVKEVPFASEPGAGGSAPSMGQAAEIVPATQASKAN